MNRNQSARRLIIITYHFPPDGTIGGQRWAGLSKYLARLGWEVHVITAASPGQYRESTGVHRHVRHRRRTVSDMYDGMVKRLRRSLVQRAQPMAKKPDSAVSKPHALSSATTRRIAAALIHLPDGGRGWIGRAASAARDLMRQQKFDAVISCGPPHSVHFAAWLATRGHDTPFWIDMRDPWSVTHHMNLPDDRLILAERWFLRRLERLVFPRAEKVIVNTREFAAALRTTDPDLDVTWLPNGIDMEQLPKRHPEQVRRCSITYVGTLYAGRNLSLVLAGIRELLQDRPDAANLLHVNIAGPMELPHRQKLEREIASAGLTSVVTFHGTLPRSEALELMSRAHLALVLAQDQPMCVPAKLYECVGLGVPTLVIAEESGAAAVEARRVGAMSLGSNDSEGMRSLLNTMITGQLPTSMEPAAAISHGALAIRMDSMLRQRSDSESLVG